MKDLVGCWRIEDGPCVGGVYHFKKDGSFEFLGSMRVRGSGRYRVRADSVPFEIVMHYVNHSTPEGLGLVQGIFDLKGEKLRLKLGPPDGDHWLEPKYNYVCARA